MNSYHHGNLKKELLDCALKMCERDGYTKLSIRSLAKESNVSQTAPYRHFKTKEDLYAEVATEGFNKIHKAISKYDSNDSKRNLIDGAKAYIKFGLKNANTYDLMFGTAIKDFTKYPMLFEAANKTYLHIRSTFKEFSKNKDDLVKWGLDTHNYVNKRLKKQEYSLEKSTELYSKITLNPIYLRPYLEILANMGLYNSFMYNKEKNKKKENSLDFLKKYIKEFKLLSELLPDSEFQKILENHIKNNNMEDIFLSTFDTKKTKQNNKITNWFDNLFEKLYK